MLVLKEAALGPRCLKRLVRWLIDWFRSWFDPRIHHFIFFRNVALVALACCESSFHREPQFVKERSAGVASSDGDLSFLQDLSFFFFGRFCALPKSEVLIISFFSERQAQATRPKLSFEFLGWLILMES